VRLGGGDADRDVVAPQHGHRLRTTAHRRRLSQRVEHLGKPAQPFSLSQQRADTDAGHQDDDGEAAGAQVVQERADIFRLFERRLADGRHRVRHAAESLDHGGQFGAHARLEKRHSRAFKR
jgi:hypothetical protein